MTDELEYKRTPFRADLKSLREWQIKGYASTFGNVDRGGDIVMPGAYSKTVKQILDSGRPLRMYWNHDDYALPIGGWDSLAEDAKGLFVGGEILNTTFG